MGPQPCKTVSRVNVRWVSHAQAPETQYLMRWNPAQGRVTRQTRHSRDSGHSVCDQMKRQNDIRNVDNHLARSALWFRLSERLHLLIIGGQNGYFKGHIFTRNNHREENVWPCSDPLSLFVRAGINEQIWTKYARTKKILILHLRVAQLVALVQKTQGGRKVLQLRKTRQRWWWFFFLQFSISCEVASGCSHFKNCLWAKKVFSWG